MTKRKIVVSLFVVTMLVVAMSTVNTVVYSQTTDPIAKEHRGEVLYDLGVHAYFDHDYKDAISRLNQVEELDSVDPRPYFFLGLAHLKNNDKDNAEKYLKKASRLEWTRRGVRDFDVATALIRIQGSERVLVERYRKQAKQEWQQTESDRKKVRYGTTKDNDKAILAAIANQGPKEFVGQAPFGARSADPFRTKTDDGAERLIKADDAVPSVIIKEEVKEEKPKPEEAKNDEAESDDVKSEDTKEEKADNKNANEEDPFGKDEKEEKPADEKKADEEKKSDDETPSADDEKEEKPADEKKADEEKKSDDETPSADDEKEEEKPADEKKADEEKKSDDETPSADDEKEEEKPADEKKADDEKKSDDEDEDPFG